MNRARQGVVVALAVLVLLIAALSTASTAAAAPGDNVRNALLCLRGGWQGYQTANGVRFRGVASCVLWALRGRTLVAIAAPPPPPPPAPPAEETPPPPDVE